MKIISHRGLLEGPDTYRENTWNAIFEAARLGFSVEFDIWYDLEREGFFLGHNGPYGEQMTLKEVLEFDNHTDVDFFVHCKSLETLSWMQHTRPFSYTTANRIHIFFHDSDEAVAVGPYTWVHPRVIGTIAGKYNTPNIARMIYVQSNVGQYAYDDMYLKKIKGIAGLCTDYPIKVKELLSE